jgi:hypothetical protein
MQQLPVPLLLNSKISIKIFDSIINDLFYFSASISSNVLASSPQANNTKEGSGTMSGYLSKWTNYLKGYQKRWFNLSNGLLSYYR